MRSKSRHLHFLLLLFFDENSSPNTQKMIEISKEGNMSVFLPKAQKYEIR